MIAPFGAGVSQPDQQLEWLHGNDRKWKAGSLPQLARLGAIDIGSEIVFPRLLQSTGVAAS